MERIRRRNLDELVVPQPGPCVSIYLPMHPVGRDSMQDAIRLRKLTDDAVEQLVKLGQPRNEANDLLAPARQLPSNELAWQARGQWIAIFIGPGVAHTYQGPGPMNEALFVDDQFHVRPLLPHITQRDRFYLLALSQNAVRLLEGDSAHLRELELRDLPHGVSEVLNTEGANRRYESEAAVHSGQAGKKPDAKGQGGAPSEARSELDMYVRRVAAVVDRHLADVRAADGPAPLILATTAAMAPLWRTFSRYPHLLNDFIAGNPDYQKAPELHAKAWPLVQPALEREREQLHQRLENAHGAMMTGLKHVIPAAIQGRIDTLFIDCTRPRWGRYDAEHLAVEVHDEPVPGDADLVELAAAETLRHRGNVFALAPNTGVRGETAEALLRY